MCYHYTIGHFTYIIWAHHLRLGILVCSALNQKGATPTYRADVLNLLNPMPLYYLIRKYTNGILGIQTSSYKPSRDATKNTILLLPVLVFEYTFLHTLLTFPYLYLLLRRKYTMSISPSQATSSIRSYSL